MTNDQFQKLEKLALATFEMVGTMREEHGARFAAIERFDGVDRRLTGVEGRLDRVERELADFRAEWRDVRDDHEERIRALEG